MVARTPVVPIHLNMTNGIAKGCTPGMPDGELGNLVIKFNKALDNDLALPCPAARLGYSQALDISSALLMVLCPLPDELMMGLTTQGMPISCTA